MRAQIALFVAVLSGVALAQSGTPNRPVVCVSAAPDTTGEVIGPLGELDADLAHEITQHHKPLQGASLPADLNGDMHPSSECDYLLKITLHVGRSTGVALNPPQANPYDPGIDPRRTRGEWLVQASYRLTAMPKLNSRIELEDQNSERYDIRVGGIGTDVNSIARRVARVAANNAAGRLKKKLKL